MKGIAIDCKTGKVEEIDDGLPMPEYTPSPEPEGLDLVAAAKQLKELKDAKVEIDQLKAKVAEMEKIK